MRLDSAPLRNGNSPFPPRKTHSNLVECKQAALALNPITPWTSRALPQRFRPIPRIAME